MIPSRFRSLLAILAVPASCWLAACNLGDRPGLNDPIVDPVDTSGSKTSRPRVNHAPTLGLGAPNVTMLEGDTKVITLKARDEDGDPIAFLIPNLDSLRALFPDGKQAIGVSSGADELRISFQPGSAKGNYRFRIVVSDTAGGVEEQLLTISVGKVNRPPTVGFAAPASGTAFKVKEGATLTFRTTATDPDGDAVTLLSLANPPWPRFGQGSYDAKTGTLVFMPSFRAVAAAETTFSDLVFRAQDNGSPKETGQISARITVMDSNSAPRWKPAPSALSAKEGQELTLDLSQFFLGDEEKDAVTFISDCGSLDPDLRWTFTPGFRDAGKRECAIVAADNHKPPAATALILMVDIADSVRLVDVAIFSPAPGLIVRDTVVAVEWSVGDQRQAVETSERLAAEGPNVIRRSFRDSLGNNGSDSVTVIRDTQAPLAPIIQIPPFLNVSLPLWTWKGGGGGNSHYRLRLDNPDPAAPMSNWPDSAFAPAAPLAEGTHTLYVQESDEAGNWSPVASGSVTLDLTAPVVKILSPAPGSWTNVGILDVQWTLDGVAQSALTTETLSTDGVQRIRREAFDAAGNRGADSILVLRRSAAGAAPLVSGTPSPTRAPEWTWTSGGAGGAGVYRIGWGDGVWFDTVTALKYAGGADVSEGVRTLFVSEADSAGNWSTPGSLTITVDRTAPVAQITGPVPEAAIASADPAITGTLVEAVGPVTLQWSGPGIVPGQTSVTGTSFSLASIAFPPGDVTVTLTLTDAAGNAGAPVSVLIHKRPGVVFVRKGGNGKGTSWQDAYGDIWKALAGRGTSAEIWVAEGEYPTAGDGAAPLDIPSSVSVFGGFAAAGTGLAITDRALTDLKTVILCAGPIGAPAVRMIGQKSVLDGFRIDASGGGLQSDSDNTARNLWIIGAGGFYGVEVVAGGGKAFRLEKSRIEGMKAAGMGALIVGEKAKVELADCSITGNTSVTAGSGGGIWIGRQADLKAAGLVLSGNAVPDSAGTRTLQIRVEDKAKADINGTVEGGAGGFEVAEGGSAKLKGADVP